MVLVIVLTGTLGLRQIPAPGLVQPRCTSPEIH